MKFAEFYGSNVNEKGIDLIKWRIGLLRKRLIADKSMCRNVRKCTFGGHVRQQRLRQP